MSEARKLSSTKARLAEQMTDKVQISVPVTIPAGAKGAVKVELLAEAMERALVVFDEAQVVASADDLAKSVVQLVRPSTGLLAERVRRAQTMQEVLAGSDWLSAADIN